MPGKWFRPKGIPAWKVVQRLRVGEGLIEDSAVRHGEMERGLFIRKRDGCDWHIGEIERPESADTTWDSLRCYYTPEDWGWCLKLSKDEVISLLTAMRMSPEYERAWFGREIRLGG